MPYGERLAGRRGRSSKLSRYHALTSFLYVVAHSVTHAIEAKQGLHCEENKENKLRSTLVRATHMLKYNQGKLTTPPVYFPTEHYHKCTELTIVAHGQLRNGRLIFFSFVRITCLSRYALSAHSAAFVFAAQSRRSNTSRCRNASTSPFTLADALNAALDSKRITK